VIVLSSQFGLFDTNSDYFEVDTTDVNLQKLNFKVHASVIYKLGESLIADEVTALSELLKNSYDADASYCKLQIDPDFTENEKHGRIIVSDNGCGMSLQTIVSGWLTISNSPKKRMKNNSETTPKYHRIPLGEKGLGRLSVQKLGRMVKMVTKEASCKYEYSITIPWTDFMENTTLDQINIPCEQRVVDNNKSYTVITVTDLINPEYWTEEANLKGLEKTIGRILSPFRFKENEFIVTATVGNFKIDVSNAVFNDVLDTARSVYSFFVTNDTIKISSKYKLDFFRRRKIEDAFRAFTFSRDYFDELYEINNHEIDGWEKLEKDSFLYQIDTEFSLDSFPELLRDPKTRSVLFPGYFDGKIYDFYFDKDYVASLLDEHALTDSFNEAQYSKYVKDNKGIKVIRDGFVVQGYGDGNVDWLNLSGSATTSGKYGDINNESTIGYVRLTGENNQRLRETTSREGFVADEYYRNFYIILRKIIIQKINLQNRKLTKIFSDYLETLFTREDEEKSPIDQIEKTRKKADQVFQRVADQATSAKEYVDCTITKAREAEMQLSLIDSLPEKTQKQYEEIISKQAQTIESIKNEVEQYLLEVSNIQKDVIRIQREIEQYKDQLSDVFELAGLGLSVELFTHEMYTTINNVNEKARSIQPQNEDLRYIQNSMNSLRKQISYFHPGLKYVRIKKERIILRELIENHLDFYKSKCLSMQISQKLISHDNNVAVLMNVGLFNQVLDNLFSNALYWLLYSRDTLKIISSCEYTIEILSNASLTVWDNGIGISKDIERDIFNPFVSNKENGRGLGLFISKNNLENTGASIRLLRERNEFGNLYKFHIDLSNLRV